MSDLLALAAAAIMGYFGVGVLALAIYDHVTDGSVTEHADALEIVAGWPVITLVVVAGLYGLLATQREVEKLGGERDE
ncbi:hypothetical protein AFNJKBDN_CDS0010 [Halorubrum virus V_ICIS4]|nr:hypothetical protein AFNJKBDN_CDS0010 [Halorubrum virus V_ICIS4]